MKILGISCYYHDSSAVLIDNGRIVAAVQEERFTRKKHTSALPIYSISYCLEHSSTAFDELDAVVYYENPIAKFDRNFQAYIATKAKHNGGVLDSFAANIKEKLWLPRELRLHFGKIGKEDKLFCVPHHFSHAASAFFPSPFEEAAVLVVDGVGEWSTTSLGSAKGNSLKIEKSISFPHSLGLLYSAFTSYCGFKVNSGEYKLMGLAPYGDPVYKEMILEHLIDVKEDGSYRLNLDYFGYMESSNLLNEKFCELFGGSPRKAESVITQKEMDLAASIQSVLEDVMLKLLKTLAASSKKKSLVLAGGIALNCTANGKIIREKIFENVWIQPAAGDAGGALGAALAYYHVSLNQPRERIAKPDAQEGSFLGSDFQNDDIRSYLKHIGAVFEEYDEVSIPKQIAEHIAEGDVVGHFFGRMEFGPRALGGRSIIGDPRSAQMQSRMNLKIKFRESFRPFAPAVLEEYSEEYFEQQHTSPYMLVTSLVKDKYLIEPEHTVDKSDLLGRVNQVRSSFPAITHIDNSARVQTVNREVNPRFHAIIEAFYEKTGCPMIINTSFNIRAEPIVCTPEDAYRCFMGTDMDVLVLQNFVLLKHLQPKANLLNDYRSEYELD